MKRRGSSDVRAMSRQSRTGTGAIAAVAAAILAGCSSGSMGPEVRLTEPERSGTTFSYPYYTDIAASGETVLAAYLVTNGSMNKHVVVRRSQDGGGTWAAPIVLNEPGYGDTISVSPKLAALPGGAIVAVWQSRRNATGDKFILARRSPDFGATWEAIRVLNSAPQSFPPAVAARDDGEIVAAYSDERNIERDIFANVSSNGGGGWRSADAIVAPSAKAESTAPSVAIGEGGDVWVAWEEKQRGRANVRVSRSTDRGATWGEPRRIDRDGAPASPIWPSIAWSKGRLTAAWTGGVVGSTNRSWLWISSSTDGGETWSPPKTVYEGPAQAVFHLLARGSDVHLVWTGGGNDDAGVYFNSSADGGATWSRPDDSPQRLDEAGGKSSIAPRIAVAGQRVAVAWQEGDHAIRLATSADGGRSWPGGPLRVAADEKDELRLPQVALGDKAAFVLWERWADMSAQRKTLADADKPTPIDVYVRRVGLQ